MTDKYIVIICGSTGAVEVDEDHAYAVWDKDWSNSDGQ
ncbi:hypotheticla protein [Serratia symbiotica SCt-VLC]|uniref:Hypotheticla protein n=1 Tax=Serratia symbiotica SCt-VLC TaxID=1347341 RepID=A0A068RC36_9GAMM|nr:hypothetical protein SCTVLC_2037 [Serratia symbiotica SCt-VLC]CDG48964.1 hypotheticla protein [Serratia symbiotica SCt-VLC]